MENENLTSWLEYCAEGLLHTLECVWKLMKQSSVSAVRERVVLRTLQERLLKLLGKRNGMSPSEISATLRISKQGTMDLLRPLLKAGLVKRVVTLKTGRYLLK